MKSILAACLFVVSLYGAELIHVSNSVDEDNLKILVNKYKRNIVINDNRAYIIPSECEVERYFGGLSQKKLNILKSTKFTGPITVTQKVFEAKSVQDIEEQIQKQKITNEVEGKVAKAFLEEKDGHLFGGLSQNPIDLTKQTKVVEIEKAIKQQIHPVYTHPTCKLLDDGLGCKLYKTRNPKLYKKDGFQPIYNNTIFFN